MDTHAWGVGGGYHINPEKTSFINDPLHRGKIMKSKNRGATSRGDNMGRTTVLRNIIINVMFHIHNKPNMD